MNYFDFARDELNRHVQRMREESGPPDKRDELFKELSEVKVCPTCGALWAPDEFGCCIVCHFKPNVELRVDA